MMWQRILLPGKIIIQHHNCFLFQPPTTTTAFYIIPGHLKISFNLISPSSLTLPCVLLSYPGHCSVTLSTYPEWSNFLFWCQKCHQLWPNSIIRDWALLWKYVASCIIPKLLSTRNWRGSECGWCDVCMSVGCFVWTTPCRISGLESTCPTLQASLKH